MATPSAPASRTRRRNGRIPSTSNSGTFPFLHWAWSNREPKDIFIASKRARPLAKPTAGVPAVPELGDERSRQDIVRISRLGYPRAQVDPHGLRQATPRHLHGRPPIRGGAHRPRLSERRSDIRGARADRRKTHATQPDAEQDPLECWELVKVVRSMGVSRSTSATKISWASRADMLAVAGHDIGQTAIDANPS